jgi:carbamoylphosphate synthase small subunit
LEDTLNEALAGRATLALEDGRVFNGRAAGARTRRGGEVVFNTSLTGYQEVFTDPSYAGQIVCLTYPHIGNVGANIDDEESAKPYIEALIVREFSALASNWRSSESAHQYLERHNVPVIWDIDTRALVRHLRDVGALRGILSTDGAAPEQLIAEARALPTMAGQELASRVTAAKKYDWTRGSIHLASPLSYSASAGADGASSLAGSSVHAAPPSVNVSASVRSSSIPLKKRNGNAAPSANRPTSEGQSGAQSLDAGSVGGRSLNSDIRSPEGQSSAQSLDAGSLGSRSFSSDIRLPKKERASAPEDNHYRVVAYDFGIKQNILRLLVDHGCSVTVVPAKTSAADVLALKPHGVFLSNGPGDPEPINYAIANIKKLLGRVPIFGICLGHQLCGLALGGKTFKLKFGHHGSNHPVKNLLTNKVEITAQNHGFCVDADSLPPSDVEITHINLNDHTNEGMRHRSLPLFSVQYHPEASPGPHDARYLFDDFIALMKGALRD